MERNEKNKISLKKETLENLTMRTIRGGNIKIVFRTAGGAADCVATFGWDRENCARRLAMPEQQ